MSCDAAQEVADTASGDEGQQDAAMAMPVFQHGISLQLPSRRSAPSRESAGVADLDLLRPKSKCIMPADLVSPGLLLSGRWPNWLSGEWGI